MVDEDNELRQTVPAAESAVQPKTEPVRASAKPPKTRGGIPWMGYFILLLIAGLGAGAWFFIQEMRSREAQVGGQLNNKDQQILEMSRQMAGLQQELAALHTQIAGLQNDASGDDSRVQQQLSENGKVVTERLDALRADLGNSINLIQRQLNNTRGDLFVADAEYLLGVAMQKLHLIGDLKSVLAAMEAADQRLKDSGDPGVFKVREALAEELAALRKVKAPDIVGISAQLLTLEKSVKELPLFLPYAGKAEDEAAQHPKAVPADADTTHAEKPAAGKSPLDELKGLFTVRRTDRPVNSVLTPEEAHALKEVLLLKLESTRAALLRGDDKLFQESLKSAIDWLKENFDESASGTKEILDELQALSTQTLSVPFPEIGKSLALLRNVEKLRLEVEEGNAHPKQKKPPEPEKPAAAEPTPAEPKPEAGPVSPFEQPGAPQ